MERKGGRHSKQVPGPKGPPSPCRKSHPLMQSNTHPLMENGRAVPPCRSFWGRRWEGAKERGLLQAPVFWGGGEDRWGRGREMGWEMQGEWHERAKKVAGRKEKRGLSVNSTQQSWSRKPDLGH